MAVRFSDEQVVLATPGRWRQRGARASYEAVSTDTRTLPPGCLFVALEGENFDGHRFLKVAASKGAAGAVIRRDCVIADPPKEFGLYEVENTLAALGGLARFHRRRFKIPIGAVTGSNGKTTAKEMIAAILETRGPALKTEGNLNNEIGVPLTLFALEPKHTAAVIEMGMNHRGEIARLTSIAQPDAGLITVVQPAHLKGLGSIQGVAEAKGELFQGLDPQSTAVVNLDDPLIVERAEQSDAEWLTFGRAEKADVRLVDVQPHGREGLRITLRANRVDYPVALHFVGEHNAINAAGAFALALALGYRVQECIRGLEAARPYSHRLNVLAAPNELTVLDDCYNANPESMLAALKTLAPMAVGGRAIAVLGDMLELGDEETAEHALLGQRAAQTLELAAFFGPRTAASYEAANRLGSGVAHFTEVDPLLSWLKPQLRAKDVVLVKGSRGMKLERVVQALTGSADQGGH